MTVDVVPSWMSFSTEDEYAAGLVELVGSVAPEAVSVYAQGAAGYISTPVAGQVVALSAAFEDTTGISISDLVTIASSAVTLAKATEPNAIVAAAANLMLGVASAAAAAAKAAGVASGLVSSLPLIATFVEGVAAFADAMATSIARVEQIREACQDAADENRNAFCAALLRDTKPRPTGRQTPSNPSGLDPTDLFRPLAYQWKRPPPGRVAGYTMRNWGAKDVGGLPAQHPPKWPMLMGELSHRQQAFPGERVVYDPRPAYPPIMASMFLGLCGGVSSYPGNILAAGRLPWTFDPWFLDGKKPPEKAYRHWCDVNKTKPMPEGVRKRMWSAIKTLMIGARDPTPMGEKGTIALQDGGRAAMTILVDLVNEQRHRGAVTPQLVRAVESNILFWTRYRIKCDTSGEIAAHAPVEGFAWCGDRIDLTTPFFEMIDGYDSQLRYLVADLGPPATQLLRLPVSGDALVRDAINKADAAKAAKVILPLAAALLGYAAARKYKLFA